MVLEHIFPENWLEKKTRYAFLLGAGYSILGIIFAAILFPSDPALTAVAFTSLMLLPEMYKIFSIEERQEEKERGGFFKLLRDNSDAIKVYLFMALGIFLVYSIASIFLSNLAVGNLFREQLELRSVGNAISFNFSSGLFYEILKNNMFVLIACFVISLLTGDGAVFLITWNASVWGTIFGITARDAAASGSPIVFLGSAHPLFYLLVILFIVLPHGILEISSYILAALSGGVISKEVLLKRFNSKRFNKVFLYNFQLVLVALILLILGALVETWVLNNVTLYSKIILQSLA